MQKRSLFFLVIVLLLTRNLVGAEPVLPELVKQSCAANQLESNNHFQLLTEDWLTAERKPYAEYKARITELESNEGVFSYELVPELLGLGLVSQEQGLRKESADAFDRALQIVRANEGLYSLKQLPILDLTIESNSLLNNWEQVANDYDRMYWLYRRNYAENDPRQLQGLKRLRRWYIEAYNKDTKRSLEDLFSSAEEVYERAIKVMWLCTEGDKRQTFCFWHKACCAESDSVDGYCPVEEESS